VDSYSQSVIKLFNDLRGKRKLVDIVNMLEDLTACYINTNDIPISIILSDVDKAIENDKFKGFSKLEIKKLYKVLTKFDNNFTTIQKPTTEGLTAAERLVNILENDDNTNKKMDKFLVDLRQKLMVRMNRSSLPLNVTEEYNDEFNAHYLRIYYGKKETEMCIIVIQNKLVMYYSHITKRQYPINLKKNSKGLDSLVDVFIERDIEHLENKYK